MFEFVVEEKTIESLYNVATNKDANLEDFFF